MLSSLTLEEIIALRLELAAKVVNFKLYGLNLWQHLPELVKDAVLKYVYSAARTKGEMAAFLGLDRPTLKKLLKKHNTPSYFDKSQ